MTDSSIMPWGKHKGEKMANIPPDYLLWLLENDKCSGYVKQYIQENKEILLTEVRQNKKSKQ